MARTAARKVKFVETAQVAVGYGISRDYNVEVRQGQVRWTVGRIMGGGRAWAALPVGAQAWTRWHTTRAAALAALEARENFQIEETWILAA